MNPDTWDCASSPGIPALTPKTSPPILAQKCLAGSPAQKKPGQRLGSCWHVLGPNIPKDFHNSLMWSP